MPNSMTLIRLLQQMLSAFAVIALRSAPTTAGIIRGAPPRSATRLLSGAAAAQVLIS
jgi:hypothetical protein